MKNKLLLLTGLIAVLLGSAILFLARRPSKHIEIKLPGNFFVKGESVPVPLPRSLKELGPLTLTLDEFQTPNLKATHFSVRVAAGSLAETALGIFPEISVRCGTLVYQGVECRNVLARFIRPQLNLSLLFKSGDIRLSSLERLKLDAEIKPDFLVGLITTKVPWLKEPVVTFKESQLSLSGRAYGVVSFKVVSTMAMENEMFVLRTKRVLLAGLPVPTVLLRSFFDQTISLSPDTDMLYHLDIAQIGEQNGMLKIAASQ